MKPLKTFILATVFTAASTLPHIFGNQTHAQTTHQSSDPIAMTVSNDNGDPSKEMTTEEKAKRYVDKTHGMAVTIKCAPAGEATAKQVANFLENQYKEVHLACFIETSPEMNGKTEEVSFYTLSMDKNGQLGVDVVNGMDYETASKAITNFAKIQQQTMHIEKNSGALLRRAASSPPPTSSM